MDGCSGYNSPEWLRVLLIDGDDCDRALFGHAVERSSVDAWVGTVRSAEEAIEYIQGEGKYGDRRLHPWPDLLVVALRLAGMSGARFLEWRRSSAARDVPAAVFTGFAHPRELEVARSLADYCVEKPLELHAFVQAVTKILEFGREKKFGQSER